ncbi:hypothetical protein L195_g044962 [Trifolium pratense]|uniref:Uncharacterized protein n=1 Tax=Trifolium pratense TaxID=57577 RepID=A0A2K3MDJ2_TRIPR|nr:hypothetical protein L195_g044962 [Trifolium pratense]
MRNSITFNGLEENPDTREETDLEPREIERIVVQRRRREGHAREVKWWKRKAETLDLGYEKISQRSEEFSKSL